jgi:hypothetical protein
VCRCEGLRRVGYHAPSTHPPSPANAHRTPSDPAIGWGRVTDYIHVHAPGTRLSCSSRATQTLTRTSRLGNSPCLALLRAECARVAVAVHSGGGLCTERVPGARADAALGGMHTSTLTALYRGCARWVGGCPALQPAWQSGGQRLVLRVCVSPEACASLRKPRGTSVGRGVRGASPCTAMPPTLVLCSRI